MLSSQILSDEEYQPNPLFQPVKGTEKLKATQQRAAPGRDNSAMNLVPDAYYIQPNANDEADIARLVNPPPNQQGFVYKALGWLATLFVAATGVGLIYLLFKVTFIPQGKLGYVTYNGSPRILEPGWHWLRHPFSLLQSEINLNEMSFRQIPLTLVTIDQGEYGLVMDNGHPKILLPGRHLSLSPTFQWKDSCRVDMESAYQSSGIARLGPIKFIYVRPSAVRPVYNGTELLILPPGYHSFDKVTHRVLPEISMAETVMPFEQVEVSTNEPTPLKAQVLIRYKVTDPEKLVKNMGPENLQQALNNETHAVTRDVISRYSLQEIFVNSLGKAREGHEAKEADEMNASASVSSIFTDKKQHTGVYDVIAKEITDIVKPTAAQWGVEVESVVLESLIISDPKLKQSLEQATLVPAQENQKLRAQRAVNERLLSEAHNNVLLQQEENKRIISKAEAEAQAAQMLSEQPLAQQQALLKSLAEVVSQFRLEGTLVTDSGALPLAKLMQLFKSPALVEARGAVREVKAEQEAPAAATSARSNHGSS